MKVRQFEQVKAELKMNEWVLKAKALQDAGRLRQARAALKQAERWRAKAGIKG